MLTVSKLKDHEIPSPLPLHRTPAWLRLFGFPLWRFVHPTEAQWVYITRAEYRRMFGVWPHTLRKWPTLVDY